MGMHSAVQYLYVYTETEGVARMAGRSPGNVPSRRAVCKWSTTWSSWATMRVWKGSRHYFYTVGLWAVTTVPLGCCHQISVGLLAGTRRGQRSDRP